MEQVVDEPADGPGAASPVAPGAGPPFEAQVEAQVEPDLDPADGRRRWQERYDRAATQARALGAALPERRTLSGLPLHPVYGPPGAAVEARNGWPGEFPYTRGIHTTGYRGKPWTIRQFAGFGDAADTNARFRALLAAGGHGLSVAFDMPTLMGRDSDDPLALGEVGHCGVAVDSAADLEQVFAGIALGDVTTSMTISGPAVPVFCCFVVAAERQGVAPHELAGTLQTDIFKEFHAQNEWLFPPQPHLRLIGDLMQWCHRNAPRFNPVSVSGYHIREAGASAVQELAFTLADGFGYVELGLARGLPVDEFAPRLTFFFDAHIDFFEEVAKFRAARRIWARWMRDRYGATSERAQWLKFHTQTAGVSLTAQQPDNNVVRTAVEALAAVLGGTNSLHTNALDEVLALPTDHAAQLALRTQQVLMEETGVAAVADPLGGSWFVEELTDRIDDAAEELLGQILQMSADGSITSGILRGIDDGWFTRGIAESAYEQQRALETGERRVVGVNAHLDATDRPVDVLRISPQVERDQVARLGARRAGRDAELVAAQLTELREVARGEGDLMAPMLGAVRAEATVGEVCATLHEVFGGYTPPVSWA